MNFIEAVKELHNGAKIALPNYDKFTYLYEKNNDVMIKYNKVGAHFPYYPSVREILSDDWCVVD